MKNLSTVTRNISANTITAGIMALFQVLSVPIFLQYWGVRLYGEWITLNTLTAYFQIADIGLNTATANSLTFCYERKELHKFNSLLSNNVIFITVAFLVLFLLLVGLIELEFFATLFRFELMTPAVINACLLLLFAQVFVGTLNNVLNGIYRATGGFARGIMVDNAIRISEYTVLLSGVAARLSLPTILVLGLAVKIAGLVLKYLDSRRLHKFDIRPSYFSYDELRRMWAPSVSFFLFPISNAIALQGPVLLVNAFLGTTAVVVFSTTRALVNFCRSVVDILHKSVWPELSLAYGRNDVESMRRLHRNTLLWSLVIVIVVALCLIVFGEQVYGVWTRHKAEYNPNLVYFFLVALLTSVLWSSSGIVLQATNRHNRLSVLYLMAAVLCVASSFAILRLANDLTYLPLALMISDVLMVAYALRYALALTGDSLSSMGLAGLGATRNRIARLVRP